MAASSSALAGPGKWPYDGESGHVGLSYTDKGSDITAVGVRGGYGNMTQSLGGWIWDATASYITVDSTTDSDWGYALNGEVGYRFANVVRGVDLDVLAGISVNNETVELDGSNGFPSTAKYETTWAKLGVGLYAQATPTTDIRFEMGLKEALDASIENAIERTNGVGYRDKTDKGELRTSYAGLSARFLNQARFPILASLVASQSSPYGISNNALMLTVGLEF
jgi:hypothetical protein